VSVVTGRCPRERIALVAYIVAVDDEPAWRDLHEQQLEKAGYTVESFDDGRYAMASCAVHRPDLVILDLGMYPSGRRLFKEFRRRWPGVPVIICTSYVGYRDDPELARADAFITKSSDFKSLIAAIERVLGEERGGLQC
jgi:DNA-binding NtrC family response regulator